MSTKPWGWKPREVERAINVARKTGLAVTSVTITKTGDITIITGKSGDPSNMTNNEVEQWLGKHARKTSP